VEVDAAKIQKKEREEMQKLSENIWLLRNRYKTQIMTEESLKNMPEGEGGLGMKLNKLIALNLLSNIEEKKKENSILKKKKYLSMRTKEPVRKMPPYMYNFNDQNIIRWDVFIMILTIYNCFYIPFEVAFEPHIDWLVEVIKFTIDLFFYFDIIIHFRTTFMTSEGEEVTDTKLISKKYILHGTFVVDVLSILPLNALIPVSH
jgi:hypothetical protein